MCAKSPEYPSVGPAGFWARAVDAALSSFAASSAKRSEFWSFWNLRREKSANVASSKGFLLGI
jgi:hypothetical protein